MPDGTPVMIYSLDNQRGLQVKIMEYGAAVVGLSAPDQRGDAANLVLGYSSLDNYLKDKNYFGSIVGRYANRISQGRFKLEGREYRLPQNENQINHLHGGVQGFDKAVWKSALIEDGPEPCLSLSHFSPDGDQGYPGDLKVEVRYWLSQDNTLHIGYQADCGAVCPVNLTNHAYFNLAGTGSGNILSHELMINAEAFTPCNENLLPTGEIRPVAGTPMDFTRPTAIGRRIEQDHPQLIKAGGYDHNWVLNPAESGQGLAATVYEPTSGRYLEMFTTEPGVQFYSGNFLQDHQAANPSGRYKFRWGFCLEAQHFPDSPNQPGFPSTLLHPGSEYHQHTSYRFSLR
jgi:aldose 1-epimerase